MWPHLHRRRQAQLADAPQCEQPQSGYLGPRNTLGERSLAARRCTLPFRSRPPPSRSARSAPGRGVKARPRCGGILPWCLLSLALAASICSNRLSLARCFRKRRCQAGEALQRSVAASESSPATRNRSAGWASRPVRFTAAGQQNMQPQNNDGRSTINCLQT